jgi:predicted ATPase
MISRPGPRRAPLLIELAGPAGVGKTTLARALLARGGITQSAIWGQPVLSLLGNGVRLLPALLHCSRQSRALLWNESRHMVRLATLRRELTSAAAPSSRMVLFDEGPVFALAWLRGFGHSVMRSAMSETWWQASLRDWARLMDAVVVVDANDVLLATRIRTRPHNHEVKEFSDPEIVAWMGRFREALNWVLAGLASHGGTTILRVTTEHETPDILAERVGAALDRVPYDD